jgi:hypothetical protein
MIAIRLSEKRTFSEGNVTIDHSLSAYGHQRQESYRGRNGDRIRQMVED